MNAAGQAPGKGDPVLSFLFGRKLGSKEQSEERVGPLSGLPILGLDALSSAAYGPEAALTLLIPLGLLGTRWILPLSLVIAALLAVVMVSYRQTIAAYPNGGGSYTVAKENLGARWGILAAASLSLDYMLNVAVAISAGVGALVSVLPTLLPHTLLLCLLVLVLLTWVNLRGVRAAGAVFIAPAYLFVGTLLGVLGLGLFEALAHGGHPVPRVHPPMPQQTAQAVGWWLLARAFGAGCTAMTGVEAVSNGVPIFKKPATANASACLTLIVGILITLLLGVGYLCRAYGLTATQPGTQGYQSILSQLTQAVAGRNAFYYLTMGSVVTVLMLSANTSFADFPRLCRLLAQDHYLPEPFMHQGRRLVFNQGIYVLAAFAAALLIAFHGLTDKLIPLFALGAFFAFTLSQAGMVMHWRRQKSRRGQWINGVGAVGTGATLIVILASKFLEGAWLSLLLMAGMALLFLAIHSHSQALQRAVSSPSPFDARPLPELVVVVPLRSWNRIAQKGLQLAVNLSSEVYVVQVLTGDRAVDDLTQRWSELVERPCAQSGRPAPKLRVLHSEYRELFRPLLEAVKALAQDHPGRYVAVVVPELVERHWYHYLLHSHTASMLKGLLLFGGDPRIIVINTPWYWRDQAAHAEAR